MAMTGQATDKEGEANPQTPSTDEEGFDAGFEAVASGTEAASSEQPAGEQPAEEPQPSGEQPSGEQPSGEQPSGEQPAGEPQPSGEQPADGSQPSGEQPSTQQVTEGDGGTPTDHGQPQQPFDPNAIEDIVRRAVHGDGQASGQSGAGQGEEAGGQGQPQIPQDWTEYLSEQEKETLSTYDQEWGEVSEAEKIRTAAMVRHARDQVLGEVQEALGPIVQHLQQSEQKSHFDQIREVHEDFDQIREGPLQEWVRGLSNSVTKKAAEDVLQQGTTQEVIDLVNMYKEDTGKSQGGSQSGQSTGAAPSVPASSPAPAQPSSQQPSQQGGGQQTPPKPKPDTEAASATAAVTTGSRGADPRGHDQDDFQAGFQETAQG